MLVTLSCCLLQPGCQSEYKSEKAFRRALEDAYVDVHPGWRIRGRDEGKTYFVRMDQLDDIDVSNLWSQYQATADRTEFLARWKAEKKREYDALRRNLSDHAKDVFPLLKSEKWVRRRDLGAIGPARKIAKIRPWRHELIPGVFVVLGLEEGKRGVRYASMAEVEATDLDHEAWVRRATENLQRILKPEVMQDEAYSGVEMKISGQLRALDLVNATGVSGLLLQPSFRKAMLDRFEAEELGAAVPIRDVLIVFRLGDFTILKPVRNRTIRLHDTQNHPAFRGLLKFDAERIAVLEPAR